MIGTLTKTQIDLLLRGGLVGRIGCQADNKIYIIPVTYVFDGKYIYAHSREGHKIEIMRRNPEVCFEIDSIETMTNWRCVVVHGKFNEMKTLGERETGVNLLRERLHPYLLSETMRTSDTGHAYGLPEPDQSLVIYRIEITEMTGRFERNTYHGDLPI